MREKTRFGAVKGAVKGLGRVSWGLGGGLWVCGWMGLARGRGGVTGSSCQ